MNKRGEIEILETQKPETLMQVLLHNEIEDERPKEYVTLLFKGKPVKFVVAHRQVCKRNGVYGSLLTLYRPKYGGVAYEAFEYTEAYESDLGLWFGKGTAYCTQRIFLGESPIQDPNMERKHWK